MEATVRILHLEDDPLDTDMVAARLRKAGIETQIERVDTLGEFAAAVRRSGYDLVLSDYTLPGTDPLEALRQLRGIRPEVPFIFVSGTLGEDVAIETLKMGATDYVLKQRPERLVPAVRRALQEVQEHAQRRQAEETRRLSEDRYRSLVQASAQAVWVATAGGEIVEDSPSWRAITGQTYEQFRGYGWQEALHPEDRQRAAEAWRRAVKTRSTYEIEYRLRNAAGEYRRMLARGVPVLNVDGSIREWVRMNTDVTEQRDAQESLRRSEEVLRFAQQAGNIGAFELNVQTGVSTWTPQMEAMHGLAPGQYGRRREHWEQFVHPDDRAEAIALVTQAFATGEPVEGQWRVVWPDGSVHWLLGRMQAFKDTEGRPLRLSGINIDITARRQAEEALHKSEQRLRATFNNAALGIVEVSSADRIIDVNERLCLMLGYRCEELIGKSVHDLTAAEDQEQSDRLNAELHEGKRDRLEYEKRYRKRDGSPLWVRVVVTAIRDEDGRWIGAIGTAEDISQRKAAEAAQEQLNRELAVRNAELNAERERWQGVVEGMAEEVWVCDAAGQISLLNLGTATAMQLPEFSNRSVYQVMDEVEILNPDGTPRPPEESPLLRSLHGEIVRGEEIMRHRRSGITRWRQFSSAPTRDAAGQITGSVAIVRDITDHKQMEEALRAGEERYRRLFDDDLTGDFVSAADGRILLCNPAFATIFGFDSVHDAQDSNILDRYIDPRERERLLDRIRQERKIEHLEAWRQRRNGERVFVVENLVGRFNSRGDLHEIVGYVYDDTGRKRSEEELRASEARFRTVSENAQAVVGIVQGSRFVYTNPYLAQISGYTSEEILAMDFVQLVRPDYRQMVADYARRRQLGEAAPAHYEFAMVTKSGQTRWIDLSVGPIVYNGRPGIVGTGYDVTERKQAEEALRQSEWQFRQIAEAMPQFVWMTRPDGYHEYFNQRWYEYTGSDFDSTKGESWAKLLHPDDLHRTLERWHHSVRTGEPYEIEYRFRRASDIAYRWFLGRALPVRDEHGRIVHWFGTCTEIHDQKQLQEDLTAAQRSAEKAKAAAEEASRAKDHFLAVLSHELRTPLTPVVTAVSMLQKQSRGDQDSETLEMIRRNVEMEARLIDDLLDVTRITRGKVELDRRPVLLCDVIRRAVEVCKPDIEARQLDFGVDIGPTAPYLIHADAARLQQVFWNLLKNAIKFTPHGGCVGIRCWLEDRSVIAEVMDSGEGIDPTLLPSIFNPFEQGGTGVTRQFGGLGLGLTITKGLVEMHGGSISAHSEGKGKGASFRVRLPIHVPREPASPSSEPTGKVVAGIQSADAGPRSLRILLVEDHGDTARMMRRLLMADGHEVATAGDVATALDAAAQQTFDLLISDLGLPDASGLDLMRELRQRGLTFPGIALSGYGQEEDVRRSHEAGFAEHLTKPTNPDRLAEAITKVSVRPRGS